MSKLQSKSEAVEALRQAIQDCELFGRVYAEFEDNVQMVTGVKIDGDGDIVVC
jgi:hypothetical protein